MFCGNGSSAGMATLLQQKTSNCMKTLSNGGVVGSGATGGSSNNLNSTSSAATTIQQTRLILPHEMVNLPVTGNLVAPSTGLCSVSSANYVNVTSSSGGAFVVAQQHSQQIIQQQSLQHESNNSHVQFSNQVNPLSQFNRFFTQNNFQDGSIGYMPVTTASVINSIKNAPSTSSHILITNSASNMVTAASTLVAGTAPLTVATLAHHNQNHSSQYEQTTPNTQNRDITVTSSLASKSQLTTVSQYENSASDQSHCLDSSARNVNSAENHEIVDNGDDYTNSAASDCNRDIKKDHSNLANGDIQAENAEAAADQDADPEIDIVINNVVCSFSVRCHLNLREIALNGFNVEFRRENGMVTMKLRRPYTTASIWSSGRITCTGATSEDQAKIAARRYARCLQKLGFNVRFHNFRVVNVLGTCSMPWAIKIVNFSERYKKEASYEPELHPGVTYKLKYPKATLKIFSTGSITVTAGSVAHVQAAIEHIFPLVYEFRKKRTLEDMELLRSKQNLREEEAEVEEEVHSPSPKRKRPFGYAENDPNEDIMYVSDVEDCEIEGGL